MAVGFARRAHTVVTGQACIGHDAAVIELGRLPTAGCVTDIARHTRHQMAGRQARSTLTIVTGLALATFDAGMVKRVAQPTANNRTRYSARLHPTQVRADHSFAHHRTHQAAEAAVVAVAV